LRPWLGAYPQGGDAQSGLLKSNIFESTPLHDST
jgi:hypothetical protein